MIVPDTFIISILEPLPSRAITFKKLFNFIIKKYFRVSLSYFRHL